MNEINEEVEIKNKINNELKGETTFNTLKDLQNILKKESTLKGLYSQTGNNTKKDIEILCREIFSKKIDLLNIVKNDPKETYITNYKLIENNKDYLKQLYLFIPKILTYLWEQPSLIAKILMNAQKIDIQKYLAPLICNNFYENILSSNYIEDQLIYIIYLLLENEINKISTIKEFKYFLNDSPGGYLLNELIDKKDIKAFFKIILKDIIETMEISSGDVDFIFYSTVLEQIITSRNQKKRILKVIKAIQIKRIIIVVSKHKKKESDMKFFLVDI